MKNLYLVIAPILMLGFSSCVVHVHFQDSATLNEYHYPTKNQNVCGFLKERVVVYSVFVDVNSVHPWSLYDINSTTDSIKRAVEWIESQATSAGVKLDIDAVSHKHGNKFSLRESSNPNLQLELEDVYGERRKNLRNLTNWSDDISKRCGRYFKERKADKVATPNRANDLERFVAALRSKYETDNVVLLFHINGYYERMSSAAFWTGHTERVEYGIVTYKNPAVIAHEVLHIFGAEDLYPHPENSSFNFNAIAERYPYEIMRATYPDISKLRISPITKYLIGWQDSLDFADMRLLYHKIDFANY